MRKSYPITYFFRALCLLFVAVLPGFATSSLDLASSNGYAYAFDAPAFDFEGSFTIDLRFRTNGAHDGCLVAKFHQNSGQASDDSYYISVTSAGGLEARVQTETVLATLSAAGSVHDGQWHHVALVYDTTAQIAEIYLDGVIGDSSPLNGPLRDTAELLRLGALRETSSLTDYFDGNIDELRFWNIARRGKQASCLKDVTLLLDTPGLVSYYPFDEEAGTSSSDLIAPFENFTYVSGATFSFDEPVFSSKLSGPGACFCGDVSGEFDSGDPEVTLVGDTVTVPAGDTLAILSNTLILDSTVSVVLVEGSLLLQGAALDSTYVLGQYEAASDAAIQLTASVSDTARIDYTRFSGLNSIPLQARSPAKIAHTAFAETFGALKSGAHLEIDSSMIMRCDTVALLVDSGNVYLRDSELRENAGGIAAAIACSLVVERSVLADNSRPGETGGAVAVTGDFDGASGTFLSFTDCRLDSNEASSGAAIHAVNADILIVNCDLRGNSGGAIYAEATSGFAGRLVIDSARIENNSGGDGAALSLHGITANAPLEFYLGNSTIAGNSGNAAPIVGQSVTYADGYSNLIEWTEIYDNFSTGSSAAINLSLPYDGTRLNLRRLTVTANTGGAAAIQLNVPALVHNSIVTANASSNQIAGLAPTVAYCITSDEVYHGPGGSFDADPLFFDYLERDFNLTAGSPAINRGDPNALYNDADGTRADIGAHSAQDFSPTIESVLDVGLDNGRQVMVQWLPSAGDDNRGGITSYRIYREVNLPILENYELVAEIPAGQLPGYGQIVTTLADSNMNGVPYYSYFVRAQSSNSLAFWDSEADSGYSVDNLAPEAPALLAEIVVNDVDVRWTAAADSDLAYYALYRATESFDPDTMAAFATTSDSSYLDLAPAPGNYFYRVRAVDFNGNESDASNEAEISLIPLPAPLYLTLIRSGGDLILRWVPVEGASLYRIYSTGTPEGAGTFVASTSNEIYTLPFNEDHKFYWVTAER